MLDIQREMLEMARRRLDKAGIVIHHEDRQSGGMLRRLAGSLALAGVAAIVYEFVLRPWTLMWGASGAESRKPLLGDDLVPNARYVTTHAVTISALAEQIWPWLVQIGQGRGGFYSHDWLENLFSLGIHSADHVMPELQDLEVGDIISLAPDNAMPLTVEVLERAQALVIRTGSPDAGPQPPGDYLKGEIAGTWAFILEPQDASTTRFIVRWRSDWEPSPAATLFQQHPSD